MKSEKQLFFTIGFVGIVLIASFVLGINQYTNAAKNLTKRYHILANSFEKTFIILSKTKRKGLAMMLEEIVRDEKLMQAFAEGRRKDLQAMTIDFFKNVLKPKYGVTKYQYGDAQAVTFLRVHKPSVFGDKGGAFRKTLVHVNKEKTSVSGFEVGTGEPALRVIFPAYYDGNYLGTVELGLSFYELLKIAIQDTSLTYSVSVKSKFFNQEGRRGIKEAEDLCKGDDVYYAFSSESVRSDLNNLSISPDDPAIQKGSLSKDNTKRTFFIQAFKLFNYSKQWFGSILIVKDVTQPLAAVKYKTLLITISATVLILVVGFIMIVRFQDIRERFMQSMNKQQREVEQKTAAYLELKANCQNFKQFKQDFISMVMFSFKTPLNACQGYLRHFIHDFEQLVSENGIPVQHKTRLLKPVEHALSEIEHLVPIVNDYYQIAFAYLKLPQSDDENIVYVNVLLEKVKKDSHIYFRYKPHITFTLEVPPSMPPLKGNPKLLRQGLTNIIRFMSHYTNQGVLRLTAECDRNEWLVLKLIGQQGIRLPSKALPDIVQVVLKEFSPELLHRSYDAKEIGLALAQLTINQLGGELNILTENDVALGFEIRLPLHAA